MSGGAVWPTEIRLNPAKDTLTVSFDDGERFDLPAEYLRVESPSAEVQGHGPSERQTVPGKRNVRIARLEPVGNYAVRVIFDDGHDTGLFSWSYLYELGHDHADKWEEYLVRLAASGQTR